MPEIGKITVGLVLDEDDCDKVQFFLQTLKDLHGLAHHAHEQEADHLYADAMGIFLVMLEPKIKTGKPNG